MSDPIMGKVLKFVVVLEKKGGITERLEFVEPSEIFKLERKAAREADEYFRANPHATVYEDGLSGKYYTLIRRDSDGEIEEQESADISGEVKVGTPQIKLFCSYCHRNFLWFDYFVGIKEIPYQCEECGGLGIVGIKPVRES